MRRLAFFLTATVLATSLAQAAGTGFTVLPFTPYSVNANGTAAAGDSINPDNVWYWTAAGGVVYTGGVSSINPGAGIDVISADGSRVAGAYVDSNGVRNASVYSVATGQWTSLGGLGGYSRTAGLSSDPAVNLAAFNNSGTVWAMSGDGRFVAGQAYLAGNGTANARATVWNTATGTLTNLGINPGTTGANQRTRANGISDDGRVVGGIGANNTPLVWVQQADGSYSTTNVVTASGTTVSSVNAVSADGQWVVGTGFINTGNGSAYRFNPFTSQLQLLGKLNPASGGNDIATAVSGDGSVIVGYENINSGNPTGRTGFIWTTAGGLQSFDDYLAGYGIDTGNTFNFSTPLGISADGKSIVGFGYAPGGTTASGFLVTIPSAVPEPSSYALLMAGLGLVGFIARRRPAIATA